MKCGWCVSAPGARVKHHKGQQENCSCDHPVHKEQDDA